LTKGDIIQEYEFDVRRISMDIGYLGPKGTFSEQAALIMAEGENIIPYHSFWEALEAVDNDKIDAAIVPIENSIEGTVNSTVDALIFDMSLHIQELLVLPVEQCLLAKSGTEIADIATVYSHPHALPQCKNFFREHLPEAAQIATSSTAEGIRTVAESEDMSVAAVGAKIAAELYGLNILADGIQDNNRNFTQFIKVSKRNTQLPENGKKTTICFSTEDKPGSLYKLLDIFSIFDVNMSKIISRPMRNKPMEYVFLIDLETTDNENDVRDALTMIKRKTTFFKNLGAYSVIDRR
jgi:prephenate dehydratase